MNWLARLWLRSEQEKKLDAELRFHFEQQVSDNIRSGMSEQEARRRARLELGGLDELKEECRDARGTVWLESTLQDVRYALRTLRKNSGFTFAVLLTLALGIGANTAIFQLLDAVRLRSLPVAHPSELVRIQVRGGTAGWGITHNDGSLTYALWEDIREHQRAFSNVFSWASADFAVGAGAQARRVTGLLVSGDFFPALEIPSAAGRLFGRDDDGASCPSSSVVISYGFWQSEFGGRPAAIGSTLVVEGHPLEVTGVVPAAFHGLEVGDTFDVALPLCAGMQFGLRSNRKDVFWLTVMGRLRPGWTLSRASDYLASISRALFEDTVPPGYSDAALAKYKQFRLEAIGAANGVSWVRRQYDTSLWLLLGITGLVLLIASANLANLALARASTRRREFAIRLALGASRRRLARQLACESTLLAASGAILGLAVAGVLSKAVVAYLGAEGAAVHLDMSLDWRMLAFTTLIAAASALLFGLAPAVRSSKVQPGAAMKAEGRGLTADRQRFSFQRFLVVVQISVSLVLIAAAFLFLGSFRNLMRFNPGFREKGVVFAEVDWSGLKLPEARFKPFLQSMVDEVRAIPEVERAASSSNLLMSGASWSLGVRMGSVERQSKFSWVSPGFLDTMQIALLAGRDFNDRDTETSPKVVIVNQTFVRLFLNGAAALGKTLRSEAEPGYPAAEYEIVGVIRDTKYSDVRDLTPPMAFAPATQNPSQWPWSNLYIRTSLPSVAKLLPELKRRVGALHPDVKLDAESFEAMIQDHLVRERLMAALSGFFGALAAVLAAIGLYGVIAYIVARRRNEIGIRMALGAGRSQVVGLVMKDAAILVSAGIAIGVVVAFALSRTVASFLFGLSAHDPVIYAAAVGLLVLVATAGSYVPARRASRVDPMTALRYE